MKISMWFLVSMLLISSCMATYKVPDGATEFADIEFDENYKKAGGFTSSSLIYFAVDDFNCKSPKRLAAFTSAYNLTPSRRVAAQEITISSHKSLISSLVENTGVYMKIDNSCSGTLKFTPKNNGNYKIALRELGNGQCFLEVINKDSPETPVEAEIRQGHYCRFDH